MPDPHPTADENAPLEAWTLRYSDPERVARLIDASPDGPGRRLMRGFVAWREQRLDDAMDLLGSVIDEPRPDPRWRHRGLGVRAGLLGELGLYDAAHTDLLELVADAETLGPSIDLAAAVHDLGDLYSHTAPEQALENYLRAVQMTRLLRAQGEPPTSQAWALEALAALNLEELRARFDLTLPDDAPTLPDAEELARQSWPELAHAIRAQRALLALDDDDLDTARTLAQDLPDECRMRDVTNASIVAQARARIAAADGRAAEGAARLAELVETLPLRYAPELLADLTDTLEAAGDLRGALDASRRRAQAVLSLHKNESGVRVRALEVWYRTSTAQADARAARAEAKAARAAAQGLRVEVDHLADIGRRDALTGLSNRAHLLESAARSTASTDFEMAVIDVDWFKHVNDTFGHATGDDALRALADELRTLTAPDDVCARLGGDEFVVLRPRPGDRSLGTDLAPATTFVAPGGHRLTASIGVTRADGEDFASVFERADLAMYEAKRSGGGQVCCR